MAKVCATNALPSTGESPFPPRSFSSEAEAHKWGTERFSSWGDELTDLEKISLHDYSGSSDKVNRYLRGSQKTKASIIADEDQLAPLYSSQGMHQPRVMEMTANIDSALAKASLPEDVVVYRAARRSAFDKTAGAVVRDNGFMSTTLVESLTDEFVQAYGRTTMVVEIRVAAGARAAYIEGLRHIGSAEVLFARGTRMRVVSNNGQRVILEVLSDA